MAKSIYELLFRGVRLKVFNSTVNPGAHVVAPAIGSHGTVIFYEGITAQEIAKSRYHQSVALKKCRETSKCMEEIKALINGN